MRLVDGDARDGDALLQVLLQAVAHLLGMGAQGRLALLRMVIGVVRGDLAQARLDLDVHEGDVVVDVEQRLGRVLHPPDDVGGDLDRVAALVVHLQHLAGDVAHAQADLLAAVPRQDPAQAGQAIRADIRTEQIDHVGLVRLQRIEAAGHQREQEDQSAAHQRQPLRHGKDAAGQQERQSQQRQAPAHARVRALGSAIDRAGLGHRRSSSGAIKVISL